MEPKEFERIREALKKAGMPDPVSAEVTMVPQKTRLTGKQAESALKLLDNLEDNDDVQNVYSNLDVDESTLPDSEQRFSVVPLLSAGARQKREITACGRASPPCSDFRYHPL